MLGPSVSLRRRRRLRWYWYPVLAVVVGVLGVVAASYFVQWRHHGRIHRLESVPPATYAIVFGAGLSKGEPSDVLRERIDMAVALYRLGKVRKLLVSGDNWDRRHVETEAMRRYAEAAGVPARDITEDVAGLSTYDSCYRARDVFGIDRAILVTQLFHLPRALYFANGLGMDAVGVASDYRSPDHWTSLYAVREFFSRALAAVMVLWEPPPRIEGPIALGVFQSGSSGWS